MDASELAAKIDHTVLGPTTTQADVETVLDEATTHGMNVCIPPCYLDWARTQAPELTIATVIGFPHGQHTPAIKRKEAEAAEAAGADELDVVLNVGRVQAGETEAVTEALSALVAAVSVPVKVIVESPLLDADDLEQACECAVTADADMVKTATGFSDGGATVEAVELMSEHLPVKASGGIGSYEEALTMFDAGAERIGASSGVAILDGASGLS